MTAKDQQLLKIWLMTGYVLVLVMVALGGITRLTGSGLSIVRWDVVTGVLPPLNEEAWEQAFADYQHTPQFKQINRDFTLNDFKGIYWWEYIHRLVGRITGLVFIIPFVAFHISGRVPLWLLRRLWLILGLAIAQGIMGWVMVMSGLQNLPYVSHYRLAMHLGLALYLSIVIWQTYLSVDHNEPARRSSPWLLRVTISLLVIQIVLGAFVAGVKAGFYYNTFPLMGDRLIPENIFVSFENGVTLQFLHRWFAFVVAGAVFLVWWKFRNNNRHEIRTGSYVLLGLTLLQMTLGIITLVNAVPISFAVAHQLTAFLLTAALTYVNFYVTRPMAMSARVESSLQSSSENTRISNSAS